jgi:hypothetical protein
MLGLRAARVLAFAFVPVAFPMQAHADDKTELAAESAFVEGTRLMKADRCEEAVVKFRESQRLDPASGTALNLGYCEAKLGRVASAWLAYRQAVRLAQAQGKQQHEALGREQADKLKPEVPELVLILRKEEPAGVVLELDGAPLEREMWLVPIPVDPGAHTVAKRGNGNEPWQKTITLARGEHTSVEVPASSNTKLPPVVPPPPIEPAGPAPVPEKQRPPETSGSAQKTWGYALGGVGAAALVTGVALFVSARVQYDGAADDCPNGCNDEGYAARESARTRAFISYGVTGAGVLLAGIGIALVLSADDAPGGADRSALVVGSPATPWALGFRAKY